ncbi:MAG: DUF4446 family protein [Clostridiaceae bacterium]|nr:DUF4446 family protein [Clostridiaceae bacterium]
MEEYLIYIGTGLAGLCFLLIIIEHFRLSGLIKKYRKLIKGLSQENINVEDLMISYSDELEGIKNIIEGKIEDRISRLERNIPYCLKNIGLVTYNAFKNVGNNMSFSIAALDDHKDGFVLTGIYTRENSYVYVKEIESGKPGKELSSEEQEALSKALSVKK